jgi:phosphoribosylamine-glycine ligase
MLSYTHTYIGLDFRGFIAIDVVLTHHGPIAIEYDLRLGDPETQALMPLIQPGLDPAKVLAQCHSDQISPGSLLFQKDRFAAVVVAVTKKYPLESETKPLHVNLTTPTQKGMSSSSTGYFDIVIDSRKIQSYTTAILSMQVYS